MPTRAEQLAHLQSSIPQLWRGRGRNTGKGNGLASGHARLDELLPDAGWPIGALTELLLDRHGMGELELFLPAMAACSARGRRLALIAPPWQPNAPALAAHGVDLAQLLLVRSRDDEDHRWSALQCLRSGLFDMVLLWPGPCADHELRRLQLAAEQGRAVTVLYRPGRCAAQHSPAVLRLRLQDAAGLPPSLQILKARGLACSAAMPLTVDGWQPHAQLDHHPAPGLLTRPAAAFIPSRVQPPANSPTPLRPWAQQASTSGDRGH